jgi:cell division protease FtsH
MVSYFGMSSKLGNLSYFDSTGQSEYSFQKPYSERTAEVIDREASAIVEEQYARAKKILTENREKHARVAELLLEREVIFSEDLEKIFGKRKGPEHVIQSNSTGNGEEEKETSAEELSANGKISSKEENRNSDEDAQSESETNGSKD